MTIELRSYELKRGAGREFHRLATQEAVPLLRRFGIDVVACGPSRHDPDSYLLARGFVDAADRQAKEDAFYASDEWRAGLRERVLALIASYMTVVIELDAAGVEALRGAVGYAVPASDHTPFEPGA